MLVGKGAALIAIIAMAVMGCGRETGGDGRVSAPAAVERRACAVDLPVSWPDAIAASAVETGNGTTSPRAVSPAGEVVAVRDTGKARDLLLIGTDRSVRELYSLPDPDVFVFGYVGIDDRWIVFATEHLPRNANGVLPEVVRIEVLDRLSGARRTVAEQSAADAAAHPEKNVLDSVVLFDGKVYWITRDTYNGDSGTAYAFDPLTGTRTDIGSGLVQDIRSGPAGAAWSNRPARLPPAVAALPAADLASLGTDGTAFGWISGDRGIGYWSPQTGIVTVTALEPDLTKFSRPVLVFDSLVILGAGGSTTNMGSSGTVVDTRSGAVAALKPARPNQYDLPVASMGGTFTLALWAAAGRATTQPDYAVGLLRPDSLPALNC